MVARLLLGEGCYSSPEFVLGTLHQFEIIWIGGKAGYPLLESLWASQCKVLVSRVPPSARRSLQLL
jgi:hypothetical protein